MPESKFHVRAKHVTSHFGLYCLHFNIRFSGYPVRRQKILTRRVVSNPWIWPTLRFFADAAPNCYQVLKLCHSFKTLLIWCFNTYYELVLQPGDKTWSYSNFLCTSLRPPSLLRAASNIAAFFMVFVFATIQISIGCQTEYCITRYLAVGYRHLTCEVRTSDYSNMSKDVE